MSFSAKKILASSAAVLLTARDLPAGMNEVEIWPKGIRANENKNVFADAVLDIAPVFGKTVFPLNATNILRLAEQLKTDDLEKCVGLVISVGKYDTERPGGGAAVSLQINSTRRPGRGEGPGVMRAEET